MDRTFNSPCHAVHFLKRGNQLGISSDGKYIFLNKGIADGQSLLMAAFNYLSHLEGASWLHHRDPALNHYVSNITPDGRIL